MNYTSFLAERAILAVNRLLIAAITSAWTTTLRHQHALQPEDEDCGDDDISLSQEKPSSTDDQLTQ